MEKGDMFSVKQFSNKEEKEETELLSHEKFVSLNDKKDGIVEDSNEDSDENEEINIGKKKQTKFQIYLERKKKIKAERKKKELEQRKERKRQNNGENEVFLKNFFLKFEKNFFY